MPLKIVFIDDKIDEASHYANLLNETGLVEVSVQLPDRILQPEKIPDADLFLVDWELNSHTEDIEHAASYLGSTLSSFLRELKPNIPIIITTKLGAFQKINRPVGQSNRFIEKSAIQNDPLRFSEECIRWIKGYKILSAIPEKNFDSLSRVLDIDLGQLSGLLETGIPLFHEKGNLYWDNFEIIQWLNNTFLAYPGFLYDSIHASTFLGIDEKAFHLAQVQNYFKDALYNGVLSSPQSHWWRSRLLNLAQKLLMDTGKVMSGIQGNFAQAFEEVYGIKLDMSKCIVSGTMPAERVCYILKAPVTIRHSIAYFPDDRPVVMDEARVSFIAIREDSEDFFDEYVNESERFLLEEIRR
jgi:hypothetical protein